MQAEAMKILFYNHTGKISGAERVLLTILRQLDRRRFEPLLVCPSAGGLTEMITPLNIRTVVTDSLAARFTFGPKQLFGYFISFARSIRAARSIFNSEKPELIHANSIRAGLVMSAATLGLPIPVIWHVHDLLPRHPLSTAIRIFVFALARTRIIAVSNAVAVNFRGSLLRWFPGRVPVDVIHNAVDVKAVKPDEGKRRDTRRLLGFSEELVVGIVGQLTPRKGQLELIRAFAGVVRDFPQVVLVIVGEALFDHDVEYAESLKQATNALGIADRVYFLGQREDVPRLMRAFDLLVVNSRVEPFGLTVIEAMASGTPVLATAVDGIKEIIEHEKTGWLVASGNHLELTASLRKLLADVNLRDEVSSRALSEVRSRFTTDEFLTDIQNLYRDVSPLEKKSHSDRGRKLAVKLSAD